MKSRKGLSEIVSAVIVITVVISGMGLYVVASQQRILGNALSVKEVLQLSADQTSEMLEEIHTTVESLRSKANATIYLHNYGLKNMTISKLYINNTERIVSQGPSSHVGVFDLVNKNQNLIIPKGNTTYVNVTYASPSGISEIPNTVDNIRRILIITDSNKIFEIQN